ncbi:MAG: NYN domain-containing protein [Candidatus Gracilibacteria bacterium]|nr:NYN domain-containing protein [Candidatus Gracilibacteria bacterium]
MQKQEVNYAFIDSQNVNLAIRDQGWKLNWTKLYKHLVKKYKCEKVYIFIGYIERNKIIYNNLENIGYSLIFKPTKEFSDGKIKGNVDAELVLQSMIDYEKYNKAIIITGDGDFACLVKYLKKSEN